MSDLARAIRKARERRGWNQYELAAAAGINQSTISRIEAGAIPRLDVAQCIAAALGVPIDIAALIDPHSSTRRRNRRAS